MRRADSSCNILPARLLRVHRPKRYEPFTVSSDLRKLFVQQQFRCIFPKLFVKLVFFQQQFQFILEEFFIFKFFFIIEQQLKLAGTHLQQRDTPAVLELSDLLSEWKLDVSRSFKSVPGSMPERKQLIVFEIRFLIEQQLELIRRLSRQSSAVFR